MNNSEINKDVMKVTKMAIKERKWKKQAKKECWERRDRPRSHSDTPHSAGLLWTSD